MENIGMSERAAPKAVSPLRLFTGARFTALWSRLLPATLFLLIVLPKISSLIHFVRAADTHPSFFTFYTDIGARCSVILFLLLMVVLFIVRTPPIKKAKGLFPRVTAIVGTFLLSIITVFPRASLGMWITIVATLLILLGTVLSIYVLAQLGRSFSLMAEARELVTSGPYAIVRHPLYLAEEIAMLGTALQFFSFFTVLIFAIHLLVQIQRMKNEEAVLMQVYPGYLAYLQRTARLIPGVY